MRLRLTLLLLCFALPAYATDTALIDRDGVTQPLVLTPANIGAATAAQGATADKVAGTVYLLADYASLQAAVDAASAAGGGTVLNAKGATVNIATTFRPKNNVKIDFNGGKLTWTGAAGGVMVENDITTYGTKFFQMVNGDIDPGANVATVFKLHSIRSSSIGNMHLVSGNNSLEFMHLYADAQVNDPEDGVRSSNDNNFGPFWADHIGSTVPVVDKVLTLEGATGGTWYGVTRNHFIGPWVFYYRTTGYDFKQYCDSNIFLGMHALTSATNDGNGTCAIFNNSATPSTDVDVWGEYFTGALSCETWYTGTPGKKGVVINKAGAINIANLTNDRTSPDYWGSNLIVDNYSMGHVINEIRGTPDNKVISHTKGNVLVEGTGNGVVFPDGSKQTSAPDNVSCGTGQHVSAFDAATGAFTCTADTSNSEGSTDANAIHKATAGEIAVITQKTTPVSGDWLLIEDSASSNAKKRINIGSLPAPFTISDSVSTTSSTTAASSTAVKSAYDTATAKQSPATTLAGYGITDGVIATGKAGGQSIYGGTGADNLNLYSTSGTKNRIVFDDTISFAGLYGQALYTMNTAIKGSPLGYPLSKIHLVGENTVGADDASTRQEMYSTAAAFPTTAYYRARGTFATPLKLLSGDRAGGVAARGYYGVSGSGGAFPSGGNAAIFFNTEEDFNDSTHNGMRITFENTAAGSGTRTEKMRIHGSGGVSIGNTTDPGANNLKVTGDVTAASFNGLPFNAQTHAQGTSATLDLDANDGFQISAASGTVTVTTSHLANGKYFDIEITSTSGALTLNAPLFTGATFPNGNNSTTVSAAKSSHYVCKGTGSSTAKCYVLAESK